jgi:hypothetical protein
MKTTIRNRSAALGIATVAGLAGIGLASGPALADSPDLADSASQTASSVADPQSTTYPEDSGDYADAFVIAWGNDNTDRVKDLSSDKASDALEQHGSDEVTHWNRMGGDGAAGTIYVDYENTVTGEKMSVAVSNVDPSDGGHKGEAHAVRNFQFDD